MIPAEEYLRALDVVRKYRIQKRKEKLTENSRFYEWKEDYSKRTVDAIEKMFNDGFFQVRSGLLRDLCVRNLTELTEEEYLLIDGVGESIVADIKALCARADFLLE